MCLVLTNPVEILAVQLVKQGIEAGGFCTGHPSNYYLLLSNPYTTTLTAICYTLPDVVWLTAAPQGPQRKANYVFVILFVYILISLHCTKLNSTTTRASYVV